MLVSSHILSDLQEVADRAVFIQGGRTVGRTRPNDLPQTQSRPWRIKAVDNVGLSGTSTRCVSRTANRARRASRSSSVRRGGRRPHRRAGSCGVRVVAIAPSGGDLEAAYLELTSGASMSNRR